MAGTPLRALRFRGLRRSPSSGAGTGAASAAGVAASPSPELAPSPAPAASPLQPFRLEENVLSAALPPLPSLAAAPAPGARAPTDEELALRLQADELERADRERMQAPSAAAQGSMTDAEFAAMLQRQEDEAIGHPAGAGVRSTAVTGTAIAQAGGAAAGDGGRQLSDEEYARLLQAEEDEEASSDGHGERRASGGNLAGSGGRQALDLDPSQCMPVLSQACGGGMGGGAGAFIGCLTGMQLAGCVGCGHVVTWLCAIGGAVFGASATNSNAQQRASAGYRRAMQEWYPDDSDEDAGPARGLDDAVVDAYTIATRYEAPAAGAGRPAATGASAPEGAGEDNKQCMICMEAFNSGELLRTLPCLHRYHDQCVAEWLRRSPECPICKRDITELSLPPTSASVPSRGATARLRGFFTGRRPSRRSSRTSG
eukprot:TRINITY_DN20574_c0_g1_i1.p1 TRINITY_DN20574_c0_g1~~TRINITY_DN20574_c0_g1_i1.p1  ORF type:complete len:427 (+),score=91.25 TRINITY_DN20574_c0_g1_i1:81-1361(+)